MTATFTNRLVGSAILVIAAVVFLPDLLDGQKQVRKDDFKAVPERPEFAEVAKQQVFTDAQHQAARDKAMSLPTEPQAQADLPVDTEFKTQEFASTTAGGPVSSDPDPQPTAEPTNSAELTPTSGNASDKTATPVNASDKKPATAETQAQAKTEATNAAVKSSSTETTPAKTIEELDPKLAAEKALLAKRAAEAAKKTESNLDDEIQQLASAEQQKNVPVSKPLTGAAWIVQVGSFSKEANANSLVSKLRSAGFATMTRKIKNAQGDTMVSVIVGPDLKKDKLEKSLPQLQQIANVAVLRVSAYQPVENN